MKDEISPELVRKLVSYDPDTGLFTWNFRESSPLYLDWVKDRFNKRYAGQPAFTYVNSRGYNQGTIFHLVYKAHRVAWAIVTGMWPEDQLDHIDRTKTNNRFINLREADHSLNAINQDARSTNKSGTKGVCQVRGNMWRAYMRIDGVMTSFGDYSDKQSAIVARQEAEVIHHGY